ALVFDGAAKIGVVLEEHAIVQHDGAVRFVSDAAALKSSVAFERGVRDAGPAAVQQTAAHLSECPIELEAALIYGEGCARLVHGPAADVSHEIDPAQCQGAHVVDAAALPVPAGGDGQLSDGRGHAAAHREDPAETVAADRQLGCNQAFDVNAGVDREL